VEPELPTWPLATLAGEAKQGRTALFIRFCRAGLLNPDEARMTVHDEFNRLPSGAMAGLLGRNKLVLFILLTSVCYFVAMARLV
jgi:hypothetical protein